MIKAKNSQLHASGQSRSMSRAWLLLVAAVVGSPHVHAAATLESGKYDPSLTRFVARPRRSSGAGAWPGETVVQCC
jgi:hypothetical protein